MFSRVFAHLFPGVEIYAYEPNPKAVEYLRKNAAGLSLHITQAAVNATGGMVHFNFSLDTTVGYISQDSPESCPAVSAQAVAEGKPIDFLKMDCEGGEWDILGDPSLLRRTRFLRMEYHLQNTRTLGDLEKLLQAGGHRLVKVTRTDPNHGMVWSVGTGGA
jgi:FkbM family methyltransferase